VSQLIIGTVSTPSASSKPASVSASLPPSISITSAPKVEDFVPPVPTAADPYPGYYQLPSGQWAAYEPEYYSSFFPDSSSASASGVGEDGRVGRHWEEFEQKGADMVDIDVGAGLEEARREAERRERLVKPKMAADDYDYKVSQAIVRSCVVVGVIQSLASSLLGTVWDDPTAALQRSISWSEWIQLCRLVYKSESQRSQTKDTQEPSLTIRSSARRKVSLKNVISFPHFSTRHTLSEKK
jgi:hypothetical protein